MAMLSTSPFSIPAAFKLIFTALFCLVILCGCGATSGPSDTRSTPFPVPPTPILDHPYGEIDLNDTALGWQIRWDFWDCMKDVSCLDFIFRGSARISSMNDVWIWNYYGTYNDGLVIWMNYPLGGNYGCPGIMFRDRVIADDIAFWYYVTCQGNTIIFWKEGQFYTLQEAYDLGLLTLEDLMEIADQPNSIYICTNYAICVGGQYAPPDPFTTL